MPGKPQVHNPFRKRSPSATDTRPSRSARGYDRQWYRIRDAFLRSNPVCVGYPRGTYCGAKAEHVDHVIPHKGNPTLLYDVGNLQAMCPSCHSRKTAAETHSGGAMPRKARKPGQESFRIERPATGQGEGTEGTDAG